MWGFFRIGKTIFAVSMTHNCFVDYIQKEVIRNIEQYVISTFLSKLISAPAITAPPVLRTPKSYRRGYISPGMSARQINHMISKNPGFRF